ncbi:hypothetical protein Lser_V15G05118 [Lactuca serriola]
MQLQKPPKKLLNLRLPLKFLRDQHFHQKKLKRFKLIEALLTKKHEDGKLVCAHVLEMKSHIDRLRMLGVKFSGKLVIDWVLQSLPESYVEFIREYYAMNYDVTLINLTYMFIDAESSMIRRTGQAYLIGQSNS